MTWLEISDYISLCKLTGETPDNKYYSIYNFLIELAPVEHLNINTTIISKHGSVIYDTTKINYCVPRSFVRNSIIKEYIRFVTNIHDIDVSYDISDRKFEILENIYSFENRVFKRQLTFHKKYKSTYEGALQSIKDLKKHRYQDKDKISITRYTIRERNIIDLRI
jgi:hypothetical protein